MPKVTIIRPNNTPEQEERALRNIESIMEKIVKEEFGVKIEIKLRIVK